jgi:uncharacterized protein
MACPELLLVLPLVTILAWLSAVGGVGGGVLMLLVLTWILGLQVAVPTLALTQLASNGGRVWFNRRHLRLRLVGWYAVGAVPLALAGGVMFAHTPTALIKRILGGLLVATTAWRWLRRRPQPSPVASKESRFVVIGGISGLASSLLGAAGPIAAPYFLAHGLVGAAYIGTEAAASVVVHVTKVAAYGSGNLMSGNVLQLAAALTPAILVGAWVGKKTVQRISRRQFVVVIEVGVLLAGAAFVAGL